MFGADGIGGRERVVGQAVVLGDLAHQICRGFPVRQLFSEEGVEHRAGGVERLEFILNVQCGENVLRVAHGQVGGVGVVGRFALLCRRDDVGEVLLVVLGQTVGRGLGGRGFQIVQIAVLLLIVGQALAHMVQHVHGELLRFGVRHVLAQPLGVEADFVHANQANGREVIFKGAEIALRVGIEPLVQQARDDVALDLQGARGDVHQMIQPLVEFLRRGGEIGNLRHIDRHDADRAGGLAASEEAAGLLAQLAQVQTQTAAHGADVAGLHIAVDVVGEIGRAVFCGHLEEKAVVLRFRPVEVLCDGVGGDGVLETAAVGIAFDHDLDEGLVDHVHLFFAVLVLEGHLLAADNGGQLSQIVRDDPVERDVGEGRLRAPAGGGVHAVDKGLHALFDLLIAQVVHLDEGREIGVEGGEGLCAGPLVLHDAEEIDHLIAQGGQVLCRGGGDLAGNAAEAFLNELL